MLRRQETRAEMELEQVDEGEEEEDNCIFLIFDKIFCDNFFFIRLMFCVVVVAV